jgi:hypothetical protein
LISRDTAVKSLAPAYDIEDVAVELKQIDADPPPPNMQPRRSSPRRNLTIDPDSAAIVCAGQRLLGASARSQKGDTFKKAANEPDDEGGGETGL